MVSPALKFVLSPFRRQAGDHLQGQGFDGGWKSVSAINVRRAWPELTESDDAKCAKIAGSAQFSCTRGYKFSCARLNRNLQTSFQSCLLEDKTLRVSILPRIHAAWPHCPGVNQRRSVSTLFKTTELRTNSVRSSVVVFGCALVRAFAPKHG